MPFEGASMNKHFLDALSNENFSSRPPVWLMRQAGRYMHEYQAIRKKHTFLDLCYNEELICKVTKMPIDAFGFDAAIVFSDILLLLEVFGVKLSFTEGVGPRLYSEGILRAIDKEQIHKKLSPVYNACRLLKEDLSVPLIGFAGAPFTLLCYLIDGKSSTHFSKALTLLEKSREEFFRQLILVKDAVILHIHAQFEAGCDAVQLFDTWMNLLPKAVIDEYIDTILVDICKNVTGPLLFFSKSISDISILQKIPAQGFSLPANYALTDARRVLGKDVVLQGNFAPELLLEDSSFVVEQVKKIAQTMQHDPSYIFNLAHGILPNTPRKNVEMLVQTIKNL